MTRADIARPVTLRPAAVTPPADRQAIVAAINAGAFTVADLMAIAFAAQVELQDREVSHAN